MGAAATFFVAMLTAIGVENVIFARALGLSRPLLIVKSPRVGILYGGLLTWVVTISCLLTFLVNLLPMGSHLVPFVRAPLFFVCVALVYVLTYALSRRYFSLLHIRIRTALPVTIFNTALFGILYLPAIQDYSLLRTLGYALGAGAGYTLAILIIYYGRKRLAISPVPRSFRGLPILLVYIGLISLAIFGLIGHGLPV